MKIRKIGFYPLRHFGFNYTIRALQIKKMGNKWHLIHELFPRIDPISNKNEHQQPIFSAGREGFEPSVELKTQQPLSRRPQSTTLAPPLLSCDSISKLSGLYNLQAAVSNLSSQGGGRGIRTHGVAAISQFEQIGCLVHSAIPPGLEF